MSFNTSYIYNLASMSVTSSMCLLLGTVVKKCPKNKLQLDKNH